MKYKHSNYNVITEYEDLHIVANIIKGTLITLGPEEYEMFQGINEKDIKENELVDEMKNVGIIIPIEYDELSYIKYHYWKTKENQSFLNIAINPSYLCNMKCKYCYQQNEKQKDIISQQVLNSIYEFIKKNLTKKIEKVVLSWCGGEAIIVLDYLYDFSIKVKNLCDKKNIGFESNLSTNGYALNQVIIDKLCQMGVTNIQTTLAGAKSDHDWLRPEKSGQPTYDTIIKNLANAKRYFKSILVIVNITSTNINGIYQMLDCLDANELKGNVYITFKRILTYGIEENKSLCLSKSEFNKNVIKITEYAIKLGLTLGNMSNFKASYINCYAGHSNTYAFDMYGNVYKCMECNNSNTKIGMIDDNGNLIEETQVLHTGFDVFSDEKCCNCVMLPNCAGGCISKRCMNEEYCEDVRESVKEYLKLYYLYILHRV